MGHGSTEFVKHANSLAYILSLSSTRPPLLSTTPSQPLLSAASIPSSLVRRFSIFPLPLSDTHFTFAKIC